jgi:hypothetical protein
MSPFSRGVFGIAATALTLGAVPLAAGRDLSEGVLNRLGALRNSDRTQAAAINRAAKADRAGSVARADVPTRTISLQLNGLSDTSVLIRMPVAQAARPGAAAPSWTKSGDGKRTVACEPVVSVLTEVAKLLEPGRCVT